MNALFKLTTLLTLVLIAWLTAGCSFAPARMSPYEKTWQTINLIDTGQTINIARSPQCRREVFSADITGRHPSEETVYATMAGYAIAHYYINTWLEAKAENDGGGWWGVTRFFQASTLLISGRNVVHNKSLGLSPWGSNVCSSTPSPGVYDPSARPVM